MFSDCFTWGEDYWCYCDVSRFQPMQEDSAISTDVWMSSALTYVIWPKSGSPIFDSSRRTSASWWTSSSRTAPPRQWRGHFWPFDDARSFCLLFYAKICVKRMFTWKCNCVTWRNLSVKFATFLISMKMTTMEKSSKDFSTLKIPFFVDKNVFRHTKTSFFTFNVEIRRFVDTKTTSEKCLWKVSVYFQDRENNTTPVCMGGNYLPPPFHFEKKTNLYFKIFEKTNKFGFLFHFELKNKK